MYNKDDVMQDISRLGKQNRQTEVTINDKEYIVYIDELGRDDAIIIYKDKYDNGLYEEEYIKFNDGTMNKTAAEGIAEQLFDWSE